MGVVALMVTLALGSEGVSAAGRPEAPPPNDAARVGLRFVGAPEGLLVTQVEPGLGAAAAGVSVGMFIEKIDGAELPEGGRARSDALRGPEGSTVTLQVSGPLDGPRRELKVVRRAELASAAATADAAHPDARRGPRPEGEGPMVRYAPEVQAFREAMRGSSPRRAAKATLRMIEAEWGGLSPVAAVGAGLTVAASAPKVAAAAAGALWTARPTHPTLLLRMAEALVAGGEHALALEVLEARAAALPPELRLGDGRAVATGSSSLRAQGLRVEALHALDRREDASAALREMLPYADMSRLAGVLGMAQAPRGPGWRAQVPPVAPFTLALADGGEWSLAARSGQVRVLSFWATWCGPCKRELPELSALQAELRNAGLSFVAVSVDQGLSLEQVAAASTALGADLPVALAPPGLAEALGVQAIPALRVIGRDGAVRYSARGYSELSMGALKAEIQSALAEDGGAGVELTRPWGPGGAPLRAFLPATGLGSVAVGPDRIALGRAGGGPALHTAAGGAVAEADLDAPGPSAHLQWLDGPVGADGEAPAIRALDPDGGLRWVRGLPGPVRATAVAGGELWVLTPAELLVLSAEGKLLARRLIDGQDLASAADAAGVFLVDGDRRRTVERRGRDLVDVEVLELPGASRVATGGEVGDLGTFDMVSGRFGPNGARRVVVSRRDAGLLAVDGAGQPAVAARLAEPARLAAADLDGDGDDELLVVIEQRGLAVVDLALP
ncbi:MAG: redoxin domain-containing protein [Deltaproteobacteria bacterium]|nr:redoxin domain-containing protein [Deltaproteobacteria bacterium]